MGLFSSSKMKLATEDQQYCLLVAQTTQATAQTAQITAQTNLINSQKLIADETVKLTKEQTEVARSQTMDTRVDGTTVKGTVGKQKELYTQQITSYQRDSEVKAGKLFVDAWITQFTVNDTTVPPTNFTNTNFDKVLTKIRTENGFT